MHAERGAPKGTIAAAHRLAQIMYHVLARREPDVATVFGRNERFGPVRAEPDVRVDGRALASKPL